MKRVLAILMTMAIGATALVGCAKPEVDSSASSDAAGTDAKAGGGDGNILVGGVNDLSGNRSVTGNAINRGVEIAVAEINANGGILGRQVTYKVYDNKNDAQETINAYSRLADVDKVSAVITSDASSICMSLIEVSAEKKVPVLGMPSDPRATMNMEEGTPYPYMFLVSQPNAYRQADLIADYVAENTDLNKAAVFYDQSNAYAVANVEAFQEKWKELGKEVTIVQTCNSTDQDFKTQLSKIKASDAEFIYTPNPTTQLVPLSNQATQLGIELPYVGALDMANPFISLVNDPSKINAYFSAVAWMEDAKLDSLNKAYNEAYGEDAMVKTVNGYDAMYVLKAAIEKAGSDDPEAIRNALENDIQDIKLLVSDTYSQDPATHAPKDLGMVICKIENGTLINEGWFEPK